MSFGLYSDQIILFKYHWKILCHFLCHVIVTSDQFSSLYLQKDFIYQVVIVVKGCSPCYYFDAGWPISTLYCTNSWSSTILCTWGRFLKTASYGPKRSPKIYKCSRWPLCYACNATEQEIGCCWVQKSYCLSSSSACKYEDDQSTIMQLV